MMFVNCFPGLKDNPRDTIQRVSDVLSFVSEAFSEMRSGEEVALSGQAADGLVALLTEIQETLSAQVDKI